MPCLELLVLVALASASKRTSASALLAHLVVTGLPPVSSSLSILAFARASALPVAPLLNPCPCSRQDLRTVSIRSVPQYKPGDRIRFTLLTRAKGSIIPFERAEADRPINPSPTALCYSDDGKCALFAKVGHTGLPR